MHPSYEPDHTIIAGACVTKLKAIFDHTRQLPVPYKVAYGGRGLEQIDPRVVLTVAGELKSCAPISVLVATNLVYINI